VLLPTLGAGESHVFTKCPSREQLRDRGQPRTQAAAISPQTNLGRKLVAAALGLLGRTDDAGVETAAVIDQDPDASVGRARLSSFRHEWMSDLYLRSAALQA
jgi:hypothetical protein